MLLNGEVTGIPLRLYIASKTSIQSLSGLLVGMEAYATDTLQYGTYNGSSWDWITFTSGSALPMVHDINGAYHNNFPLTPVNGGTGVANTSRLTLGGSLTNLTVNGSIASPTLQVVTSGSLNFNSNMLTLTGGNPTIGVGSMTFASGKTLTLTNSLTNQGGFDGVLSWSGAYTLTVPATGTAALLNQANSFTLINPLTTLAESWIGPSSTAGIYFKGGNVGIGTSAPPYKLDVATTGDSGLRVQTVGGSLFNPSLDFNDTTNGVDMILAPNGTTGAMGTYSSHNLSLVTGHIVRLTISSTGVTSAVQKILRDVDNSLFSIGGGSSSSSGESLINLYGNSHATTPGRIDIFGNVITLNDATFPYTEWVRLTSSNVGIGTTAPATLLHATLTDATTNAIVNAFTLGKNVTGAGVGAAGLGVGTVYTLESSTTVDTTAATDTVSWVVATHASRTARRVFNIYDTAIREAIRIEASGTAAMIGVLGHAAQALPAAYTVSGAATRTMATDPSSAFTGIDNLQAGTVYATVADLNTLRAVVSTEIGVMKQLLADLAGYGWTQ